MDRLYANHQNLLKVSNVKSLCLAELVLECLRGHRFVEGVNHAFEFGAVKENVNCLEFSNTDLVKGQH